MDKPVAVTERPGDAAGKPLGIAILGSTGSIGRQALDLVRQFPDRLRVITLAAGSNTDLLARQAIEFGAEIAVIADSSRVEEVRDALQCSFISHPSPFERPARTPEILHGSEGLRVAATHPKVDRVLVAMSGFSALHPSLKAAAAGKDLCLANKEALIAAGELLLGAARASGARILPVDSEHSAIFQCLQGEDNTRIQRLVLTASGGAFRDLPQEALSAVTPEQALRHPTWRMGPKITVDSATLMNKGLEIIEAHRLFGVEESRILTVLHPQSIVHSLVEFVDGSSKAQVGPPDMRVPIQYALLYPERMEWNAPRIDWSREGTWSFAPLDEKRYPCVGMARHAASQGGTGPAIISAADEVGVEAFLQNRIGFLEIAHVVQYALDRCPIRPLAATESLLEADQEAREAARHWVKQRVIG